MCQRWLVISKLPATVKFALVAVLPQNVTLFRSHKISALYLLIADRSTGFASTSICLLRKQGPAVLVCWFPAKNSRAA